MRRGRDADVVTTDGRAATGSSSSPPCCSPSPPSRRRGAATSRPAGTGSRRRRAARANALRIESAKAAGLANSQTEIDVATFTQWVNAYAQEQTELADFYFKRFREEFRPAVDAWVATRPLQNAEAPLTPFAMPQYRVAARADADRLDAEAELSAAEARRNIQRASNYVLGVVLFASALFFAGMSTKLDVTEAARRDALHRVRRLPLHRDLDRHLARQPLRLTTGAMHRQRRSSDGHSGRRAHARRLRPNGHKRVIYARAARTYGDQRPCSNATSAGATPPSPARAGLLFAGMTLKGSRGCVSRSSARRAPQPSSVTGPRSPPSTSASGNRSLTRATRRSPFVRRRDPRYLSKTPCKSTFDGGGGNRTRVRGRTGRPSTSVVRAWISPDGRRRTPYRRASLSFGCRAFGDWRSSGS